MSTVSSPPPAASTPSTGTSGTTPSMPNGRRVIPTPGNAPVSGFAPGSPERAALSAELAKQSAERIEIPLIIGGREVRTGNTVEAVMPHNHGHVLATVHMAGPAEVDAAVAAARDARRGWETMPYESRAAIFLKAAALLEGPWRMRINASTMLNQSKTCHQAEIDAACELIDFLRFNCKYMEEIYEGMQPPMSPSDMWNTVECRPLGGFVYAVTPFNFTSIAINLAHAPALMGNTAIWKPSPASLVSNYYGMKLLEAAGLPDGVINFLPGDAPMVSDRLIADPDFAGLHFTGSTKVFRHLWHQIGANLEHLRNYPRIVGETGGKDFIVAHPSAEPQSLAVAMLRGAFEFQGQKCSAASRAYIPRSLWNDVKDRLVGMMGEVKMGDVADYENFVGAVIHEASFEKCKGYIDRARASSDANIVAGGECDRTKGWFVAPTVIEAQTPDYESMREEIFGPILTVYVYEDNDFESVLELCDGTSPYALTGAIFALDRAAVELALDKLRYAAGNFYINDKPTGAVVGQQPFGGSRASGTNDKAGSPLNLMRWMSPRTVKETFSPPVDWKYPFVG